MPSVVLSKVCDHVAWRSVVDLVVCVGEVKQRIQHPSTILRHLNIVHRPLVREAALLRIRVVERAEAKGVGAKRL